MKNDYLVISDLQIPFEAEGALKFCRYVKRHYKIPDENCLCVGDEVDNLFGSLYNRDPDGYYSAETERVTTKDRLREWFKEFPHLKVAISNHGTRWARKAAAAEIPSQMMRTYQEVLEIPSTWQYKETWKINAKHPFLMKHGMEYSGVGAIRQAPITEGMNVVFGHLHSLGGVERIHTTGYEAWGMCVGCLIDVDAYAFNYCKNHRFKPVLGMGVILNEGKTPIFLPYEV